LCAQWRAAIASEEAAKATWWAVLIAAAGGALSFIGTCLLYWTLVETRRISKRQMRAYVHSGYVTLTENLTEFYAITPLTNSGQTPAINVRGRMEPFYVQMPLRGALPEFVDSKGVIWPTIGPSGEKTLKVISSIDREQRRNIVAGRAAILARLEISYTIFTGERITEPPTFLLSYGPNFIAGKMTVIAAHDYGAGEEQDPRPKHAPPPEEPELSLQP
jgi:hypothetical protein